jgi:hypothetical protein
LRSIGTGTPAEPGKCARFFLKKLGKENKPLRIIPSSDKILVMILGFSLTHYFFGFSEAGRRPKVCRSL